MEVIKFMNKVPLYFLVVSTFFTVSFRDSQTVRTRAMVFSA